MIHGPCGALNDSLASHVPVVCLLAPRISVLLWTGLPSLLQQCLSLSLKLVCFHVLLFVVFQLVGYMHGKLTFLID